jgi:hypothetical protein
MLDMAFDRVNRILWIRFSMALTRENLRRLDKMAATFVAREGAADAILDFSGAPQDSIETALVHERTNTPLIMPGQRRVFIAPHDQLFGMLRMYAAYQADPPSVVRTFDEALEALQLSAPTFEPVEV